MSIDWTKMRPTAERHDEERLKLEKAKRAERDMLISKTDFYFFSDYPGEVPESILEYRQALRDITEQPGWPETIVWPVKPT